MIKRLQLKFIFTNMCALFCLILSIFFGAYFYMQQSSNAELNEFLDTLIEQDGIMVSIPAQGEDTLETLPENENMTSTTPIKWFSVKFDKDNQLIETNYQFSDIDEESSYLYGQMAFVSGDLSDKIQGFQYKMQYTDYGTLIVFADQRIQNGMLENLLSFIYVVTVVSFLFLLALTTYLSKLMIKPVEETLHKQKTFIADSGHELKTPLTIISANVQMLEQEAGTTSYSTEIKAQSKRMYGLIADLLTLTKTEIIQEKNKTAFDFSKLVADAVLHFELIAFELNKKLCLDAEENIMIQGSQEDLAVLLNILIDNAIKYGLPGQVIEMRVYEHSRKTVFEIKNQCEELQEKDVSRIFDRFYRLDASRARNTGGYGLGLSIAKNIVENHHGKITACVDHKTMLIRVIL